MQLTMLNAMAGREFPEQLKQHREWGLSVLDLKDGIFGKNILQLTLDEARTARKLIDDHGMSVYCLSTGLLYGTIEDGEGAFKKYATDLDHILKLAEILQPKLIRLLSAKTSHRKQTEDSTALIREKHAWVPALYQEFINRIDKAGYNATIENEVGGNIFSRPHEVISFFELLDRKKVFFTWDVQNLWEEGTFPTPGVYQQLKPLIGYFHLKGGRSEEGTRRLRWRASLADASWPVAQILRQVLADRISPVICLNPSHGAAQPGYDYTNVTARDVEFTKNLMQEVLV